MGFGTLRSTARLRVIGAITKRLLSSMSPNR
jgi:hypothetical protein